MNITSGTIIVSAFLTLVFIFLHQLYLKYRSYTPFASDAIANESYFFLQMIARDYYMEFRGFKVEGEEEFARKLRMVSRQIWGVTKTKNEWYYYQLRNLLHKYHKELLIAYNRFNSLRHMAVLDFDELEKTIGYTNEVLNKILIDFQNDFYHDRAS